MELERRSEEGKDPARRGRDSRARDAVQNREPDAGSRASLDDLSPQPATKTVLRMQRLAGNSAVTSALGRRGLMNLRRGGSEQRHQGGPPTPTRPDRLDRGRSTPEPLTRDTVQRDALKSTSLDSGALQEFNSAYNLVTGAYSFLTIQQTNAIDSIYTEAKKPKKPSLFEDVLIALATAAVAGCVSIISQKLTAAIPRAFRAAEPGTMPTPELEIHLAKARANVDLITKAAHDAFKTGANSIAAPRIRALIQSGKKPVDAFFEGQKQIVAEAGMNAFTAAETGRNGLLELAALDPGLPLRAAQALAQMAHEVFTSAYDVQKDETLAKWLTYQAQARLGTKSGAKTGGKGTPAATDMSKLVTGFAYHGNYPGVIFVEAEIENEQVPIEGLPVPVWEPKWRIHPMRADMSGLSNAMLSQLSSLPIRDLHLPVVYRVASYSYRDPARHPFVSTEAFNEGQFSVAVSETGETSISKTLPWHDEQLKAIGGIDQVHYAIGGNTLTSLKVEADKD